MKINRRSSFFDIARIFALVLIGAVFVVRAADKTPKYSVEEIMKAVFKGEDSTHKKIVKGNATPADYDRLVDYISALPLNVPPQGDTAGWKQKTTALFDAALALKTGKSDALPQYSRAANCQACHRIYRPD